MKNDPLENPTVEGAHRIMPAGIDATRHFWSAFGEGEAEFAALGIVIYCQAKGEWASFTPEELTAFFVAARDAGTVYPIEEALKLPASFRRVPYVPHPDAHDGAAGLFMSIGNRVFCRDRAGTFHFSFLHPEYGALVRRGDDGRYRVTEWFIERCHWASPSRPSAN